MKKPTLCRPSEMVQSALFSRFPKYEGEVAHLMRIFVELDMGQAEQHAFISECVDEKFWAEFVKRSLDIDGYTKTKYFVKSAATRHELILTPAPRGLWGDLTARLIQMFSF